MLLKGLLFVCLATLVGCAPVTPLETGMPTNTPEISLEIPAPTKTPVSLDARTPLPADIQRTPDPAAMNINRWESTSPDGKWIAQGIFALPKPESDIGLDYTRLTLENTDGSIRWTVKDTWRETGLGYTLPKPVKWSQEGSYFYFTNSPVVEGCTALPVNGSDLQRVDLETGEMREMLPDVAFWISLSPDESLLAYIKQGSSNLWIRDLNTGDEKEIKINPGIDFDAGNIVWSPNGQFLALTLANQPCTGNYPDSGIYAESTSILIVDSSTYEVRKVAENDKRRLVTSAWDEADKIELKDPDKNLWTLDVATGELTQQ